MYAAGHAESSCLLSSEFLRFPIVHCRDQMLIAGNMKTLVLNLCEREQFASATANLKIFKHMVPPELFKPLKKRVDGL